MIKNSTKFVVVYISLKQILRRSEYCWSYFGNCFHWKAWRTINYHSCGTKEMSFHFEMQLISGWGSIKNIGNGKLESNDQYFILKPFSCSHAQLLPLCPAVCTLWTIAHQALVLMGFSRQVYWSGLPCPLWNENISCHINKQEMSQPSVISGLQMGMRAPKTEIQRILPPLMVIAEELGECKKQPYATP